ncbi:hypothetical protein BHE74_00055271 [Ensete ventricosum]|nr:hypothetical protein GW17_00007108 [Ensete ventricosum]RWW39404.1 hypothetical protein BHE74_00055271 [Ensete ventricosum]RZR82426.1 hypothetical protein BHM03_00008855 [Ensete ventricosum]
MVALLDKKDEGLFVVVATLLRIRIFTSKAGQVSLHEDESFTRTPWKESLHTAHCTLHGEAPEVGALRLTAHVALSLSPPVGPDGVH